MGPPDFGVMDPPDIAQWDHRPEPLFNPERRVFARRQVPGAETAMRAPIDRFSRVALVWMLPDRGSCAVCGGRFSAIPLPKRASARAHRNPVPSWHYTHGRAGWREGS